MKKVLLFKKKKKLDILSLGTFTKGSLVNT